MKVTHLFAALAAIAGSLQAQDPCEGNGVGGAYISTTSALIGGTLELDLGSTAPTSGIVFLSTSSHFGPVPSPFPFLPGTLCINPFAPGYRVRVFPLDPSGNTHLSIPITGLPGDVLTNPPIYANAVTLEAGPVFSMSKTVRTSFENPNSHRIVGALNEPRAFHTATALGTGPRDDRTKVLIAGGGAGSVINPGALATTEIYDLVTRTFTPGPVMAEKRVFHAAARLHDGRVLITGGIDPVGVASASCVLFDADTSSFSPAAPLGGPRAGHAMTVLNDGRVLVTGGVPDYQNAGTDFINVLNGSLDTAELYDPLTDTWTPVAGTMAAKRLGHSHTLMNDGRVLIVSGIQGATLGTFGGQFPVFTPSVELFDPTTDSFVATTSLGTAGRAFHGASLLASGDVLITGGIATVGSFGEAAQAPYVWRYDSTTGIWVNVPPGLPEGLAWHAQIATPDGRALTFGGFGGGTIQTLFGSARVGAHDGATHTSLAQLGTNLGTAEGPRFSGGGRVVALADGTYLYTGGFNTVSGIVVTSTEAIVFQE